MIASHATGQNRAAITAIAVLIAAVFEWVNRGLPAGGESRSLALVPAAARKAPTLFSRRRARFWRWQRARSVAFYLWAGAQDRRPGLPRLRF